jgi:hypothetical protein
VIFTPIREHEETVLLKTVEFPIDKAALIERARQMEVPVPVREALERLRDGTYHSRSDFVVAVEEMVSA